jgi:hypothetical protein
VLEPAPRLLAESWPVRLGMTVAIARLVIHSNHLCRRLTSLLLLGLVLSSTSLALAEGTDQVGTSQPLRAGTILGVDVRDSTRETIRWTGNGNVTVIGPNGSSMGSLSSGATLTPSQGNGAYRLTVARDQSIGSAWDVSVLNAIDSGGRLFSWNWQFNAGSYAQSAATNASFYALVRSGNWENTSVIELKLSGLAGYIYDINANSTGVVGVNAGRSVPESGNSTVPVHQIYLKIPSIANFASATPAVSGLNYVGGVDRDVNNQAITPCTKILPGASRGYFYFTSQTTGTYHLQCDLNRNGTFEEGPTNDLFLVGTVATGTNTVAWDGRHNGTPIAPGDYACRVRVTVGEFHYVGRDIETSYPGMRIFRVNSDGSRSGLKMYWNDSLVSNGDIRMPNNQFSLHVSQGTVDSGTYASAASPNVNARAWGNFSGNGKGNATYLDTYVWLSDATTGTIHVTAADGSDGDDDGLTDFEEECLVGSDPENPDTDDDGQPDGAQYAIPESSAFSGLESNGRLSTALARRSIRRLRMSVDPLQVALSTSALTVEGGLTEWFPGSLRDAESTLSTPADLLSVTNAVEVAGVDYQSDGQRVAGALLVATAGELYEHQKGVCDRVKGARLVDVQPVRMNGVQVFQSTTSDPSDGRLEYSVTISLVDDAENNVWTPSALWVKEQAPEVAEGARVLTLQSWASSPELARELAESILERAAREQPIAWPTPAPIVDDEDWVANTIAPAALVDAQEPSVLVQQVSTLGGATMLHMRRQSGGGTVSLRVVALAENGKDEIIETYPVELEAEALDVELELAPFLDATIDILDNDVVVDRVWITDGAWAPFDAQIWSGDTSADHFSRTDCDARDISSSPEGKLWNTDSDATVHLAGCARTTTAGAGGSGLSRHLTRPIAVSEFASLAYFIETSSAYQVCLEGNSARECVAMPAAPNGKFEAVPSSAFSTVSEAELITFISDSPKATRMEVSSVTLLESDADTREKLPSGLTCSTRSIGATGGANGAVMLLLAALLLSRRRRA